MDIKVKNSGWVELQTFDDRPDGILCIGEELKNIPFNIKRFYFISNLGNRQAVRGKHAHREIEQILFCISGGFDLLLDDGLSKQTIRMEDPGKGILLGKMLWHEMTNFSNDCVILVVANDYYRAEDYIRNYDDFNREIQNNAV
jgi:dTDP-4-dehydrorhamnose 3,5-epimerase-like enzyme